MEGSQKMTKEKHNKKPGLKDVVKVVSSMIQDLQKQQQSIDELYGLVDMYIKFAKNDKKFKKYLDIEVEKMKAKAKADDNNPNEPIDGEYTEGDKEDAGVGTEGVRA